MGDQLTSPPTASSPPDLEPLPPSHSRLWQLTAGSTAFWVGLLVVVLYIGFGIKSDGIFFTKAAINTILLDAAVGILLACGMTFLLAAAQLDISVGPNLVLSSVAASYVVTGIAGTRSGVDVAGSQVVLAAIAGCATAMTAGAIFGLINGLIVTRMKVNAFIATLGTGGMAAGAVLVITNGTNINEFPLALQTSFGAYSIRDLVPIPALLALVVAAFLWFVMEKTRFGVYTVAIGTSREAAMRSGVTVTRVTVRLFVMAGLLAGLGGFLTIARFATTNISGGQTESLAAIAAAVIGGTSLFGGKASVGGSTIGALLPVVLASGLIVIGVSSFYQQIVIGGILILAVYVDQQRRRRREA